MNFPGYAFSRRPLKSASDWAASHSEVHTHGTVKMAAIAISTPIVARAPVVARRARVTARAAVAPSAKPAVSIGARNMMSGSRVESRNMQVASGRKALVW